MENAKKCTKCGKVKLFKKFYSRGDGNLKSHCIECINEYGRNYQRKMAALGRRYENNYGVTLEQYNRLAEQQNGKCAICRKVPDHTLNTGLKSSKLFIDHDKNTKQIRGLLCFHCNTGIGKFDHSIDLLEAAIKYLNKGT